VNTSSIVIATIGAIATMVAAYLGYLGYRRTATGAKAASDITAAQAQMAAALAAWESLLEPYKEEVAVLRAELRTERQERAVHERSTSQQLREHRREMDALRDEVATWQRVARTIARWATQLRDELLRMGGTIPATPEELLTLQALDDQHRNT
jgi:predicted  nucleic acid-binding Zn-ribbon protein